MDNIIFISTPAAKLPPEQRNKARRIGILLAAITRLALLMVIAWIVGLTAPLFSLSGHAFSWRDLILIGGGLFLIGKATHEIHQKLAGATETVHAPGPPTPPATATFGEVNAKYMLPPSLIHLHHIHPTSGPHRTN